MPDACVPTKEKKKHIISFPICNLFGCQPLSFKLLAVVYAMRLCRTIWEFQPIGTSARAKRIRNFYKKTETADADGRTMKVIGKGSPAEAAGGREPFVVGPECCKLSKKSTCAQRQEKCIPIVSLMLLCAVASQAQRYLIPYFWQDLSFSFAEMKKVCMNHFDISQVYAAMIQCEAAFALCHMPWKTGKGGRWKPMIAYDTHTQTPLLRK